MEYEVFVPPFHLRHCVKYFWSLQNSKDEVLPPVYKSMADGFAELVFATNGSFKEYFNFSGYLRPQHAQNRTLTIGKTLGLFGVRLYPYMLQQLFGVASHELINDVHALDTVVSKDLIDKIAEAENNKQRVQIVSDFLTRKLNQNNTGPIEKVIHQIGVNQGLVSIPALQNLTGLSERQFERRFKSAIGFTPKYFARIVRFQHTRKKFFSPTRTTFAELAYESQYADQSHFIREFKEFSGMSVTDYFNLVNKQNSEEAKVIRGLIVAKDEPYSEERHSRPQTQQRKMLAR